MEFTKGENDLGLLYITDSEDDNTLVISATPKEYMAGLTPEQANLIAAAPDLEGVLRQFVRYCDQWQRAHGTFPSGDGRALIVKNARKALAKANPS